MKITLIAINLIKLKKDKQLTKLINKLKKLNKILYFQFYFKIQIKTHLI